MNIYFRGVFFKNTARCEETIDGKMLPATFTAFEAALVIQTELKKRGKVNLNLLLLLNFLGGSNSYLISLLVEH